METQSSIFAWKAHEQRNLVGYSQWGPSSFSVHGAARVRSDLVTLARIFSDLATTTKDFKLIVSMKNPLL